MADDLGCPAPTSGDLSHWARQGVLLLNTALTVEAGAAGAHLRLGWSALADEAVAACSAQRPAVAFLLWGGAARRRGGAGRPRQASAARMRASFAAQPLGRFSRQPAVFPGQRLAREAGRGADRLAALDLSQRRTASSGPSPSPVVGVGELQARELAAVAADDLHAHRQAAVAEADRHADAPGSPTWSTGITTSIQR